eukprot:jgi/Botrbrau1/16849/Bobra.150_2s0071.1
MKTHHEHVMATKLDRVFAVQTSHFGLYKEGEWRKTFGKPRGKPELRMNESAEYISERFFHEVFLAPRRVLNRVYTHLELMYRAMHPQEVIEKPKFYPNYKEHNRPMIIINGVEKYMCTISCPLIENCGVIFQKQSFTVLGNSQNESGNYAALVVLHALHAAGVFNIKNEAGVFICWELLEGEPLEFIPTPFSKRPLKKWINIPSKVLVDVFLYPRAALQRLYSREEANAAGQPNYKYIGYEIQIDGMNHKLRVCSLSCPAIDMNLRQPLHELRFEERTFEVCTDSAECESENLAALMALRALRALKFPIWS